ncbi:glycoside hydrolase family 2 protein [Dysgonomonas termitidis]|uniref:Sugar-binding domain-containing protein n=1 Tax=Dysgonomonas termitidis TaxID=1516126 RepID=A0ABV9L3V5_9BACT
MNKIFLIILSIFSLYACADKGWELKKTKIVSDFALKVTPDNVWQEYPRPIMQRKDWQNLNGLWEYKITQHQENTPSDINEGKILVPFAIESALSGVQKTFLPEHQLWYKRTFSIPGNWEGKNVLLHFGAVDFASQIWINGEKVGSHEGSSDAFTFDITAYLKNGNSQEIIVSVIDSTDTSHQPIGKQTLNPRGIKYTAVSGIWKTVWLEPVSQKSIETFKGSADIDNGTYSIRVAGRNISGNEKVRITVFDQGKELVSKESKITETLVLGIPDAKRWSPDNPYLYDMKIELVNDNKVVDSVDSYFAMRKISVAKDENGIDRMMLNNEFVFQYGTLDQGWWPDGLLTPPSDEALKYDIEFLKKAGFNTIRKHIKIEPERFYYHCDKMGMIVWQDAVCSSEYNLKDRNPGKQPRSAKQFEYELKQMIDQLGNYPSIVMWVVFNEGWGQYGEKALIDWTKQYDPSRLTNISGWVDFGNGDISDVHRYPGPGRIENAGKGRAFVVGEFGGLGLPVQGHTWIESDKNWGYETFTDIDVFRKNYEHLIFELDLLADQGLSAAIYTQTTDVEIETNGLLTYDRKKEKIPAADLNQLHKKLYEGKTAVKVYLPDSETESQMWKYTIDKPQDNWTSADYNDAGWKSGKGSFGYNNPKFQLGYPVDERTSFAHIPKTTWNTEDLWLRKEIELMEIPVNPLLKVTYDDSAEIYINDKKVLYVNGRVAHYGHHGYLPIENVLKTGKNIIAVHCRNDMKKRGNQMFDLGIVEVIHIP